ncbi:MAG: formate dehydrogenase accessory protein FdhE [Candidatus Limnocylindria bacterium]
MPTQLEIDEARARWRELAALDPPLGPVAAFHDERLAELERRPAPDVSIEIDRGAAESALSEGIPLLERAVLSVNMDDVADELRRLALNLAETAVPGSPAALSAERLAEANIDLEGLLAASLSDDRDATAGAAKRAEVDAAALHELLGLALQPFLWEAATELAATLPLDTWDRGYCPVCGAWPALAELVGPERRRVLRCGRCGGAWSWLVLLCPYCGNDDHRTLGSRTPVPDVPADEKDAASQLKAARDASAISRIDSCERCHGYLKAIGAYASNAPARLLAEDVATLYLDLVAREAGYRRPGTVDAATAGIPRLVRERARARTLESA